MCHQVLYLARVLRGAVNIKVAIFGGQRGRYLAESICTECHGDNGRLRVPGSPDLIVASAYTREVVLEVEKHLFAVPEVTRFFAGVGMPVGGPASSSAAR